MERSNMQVKAADAAARGQKTYESIRAEMGSAHWSKMAVIDVNSGDYEVADDMTAALRLLERRPDTFTWGELIGYPAPYHMGARITAPLWRLNTTTPDV